ncbi:MAG: hypothetical protein V2A70_03480 [Candidatus Omnitrophota bacterium]
MIALLIGSATSSFAALNYNVKNDTDSFLFVNGTSGNVGVGTAVPLARFDVQAGALAPAKIISISGSFPNLDTTKTGLYTDVTAPFAGTKGATGSWSEIRTTADAGTYTNAIAGLYGEVLHSGNATADFLMGLSTVVNQIGAGTVTNAYGLYPQVWKGTGTITNAYGMYYQGVPTLNGDTLDGSGTVVNQYGIGLMKPTTATTRNIALLIDDTTEGAVATGNFSIYEESGYSSYFTGNIGLGTLNPEAKLALHSTSATLVDSHVNDDLTGTQAIESHYAVGQSGQARTTPADVQKFRFFFGGFDQEVAQIAVHTPSVMTGAAIGAMDVYTQGLDGLVKRMTIDQNKAMFSGNLGVGTTAPRGLLEVDATPYTSPFIVTTELNVGIGTFTADTRLTVGPTPPTAVPGSSPVAALKGDLIVDGKIYGDGSQLTGVSGIISGLTAGRVPFAATSSSLADSSNFTWDNVNNALEIGGTVGANSNGLKLSSTPAADKTKALLSLGADPSSSNNSVNGTYIGINTPVGYSGNWFEIENNGVLQLRWSAASLSAYSNYTFSVSSNSNPISSFGNSNGGTLAGATFRVGASTGGLQLQSFGGGYTTSGANVQAGSAVSSDSSAVGGLSVGAFAAAAPIRFYTGGSTAGNERVRIDAVGNVGVGTIAPRSKLEIVGSGSTTGTAFQIDDNLYNPKVTVLDDGSVGIGTASPTSMLNLYGTNN